ncbi:MAG TPA: C25 family cysteine peptidase, partial [Cyclobacteriaceae bacterium]
MKRGLIVLFYLLPLWLFGQVPNSWVNFNQSYYRIPVAKDGVYRLSYTDLQDAGFPVSSVDTRFIQVIHRGVEQAIYFKQDIANARFDATEYIEFYGQRNDGLRDANLYKPSTAQPHPYYNLYSDTSAYFLTWNISSTQGKRMEDFFANNVSPVLPKETSHTAQQLSIYTQEYSGGETLSDVIQYSYYNKGEGWTGSTICTGSSGCIGQLDFTISNLSGIVTSAASPVLELQLAGRDDLGHMAEIYVGPNAGSLRLLASQSFIDFETPVITSSLNWSDIGADGKMVVRVKAQGLSGERDRLSVSYIKLRFAQNFDMTSLTEKKIELNAGASKAYIELTNAPSSPRVWDITDANNIVNIGTTLSGTTRGAVVPNTSSPRTLYVSSQFLTPEIKAVSFQQINPTSYNYLIITHESLMGAGLGYGNAVQSYADYRASKEGGAFQPLVVTIDQLYNQFNYGETSSLAIYEFMKFMYANGHPKYLFLIGKGREVNSGFHRKTILPAGELKDLVPVGGYPASDMVFTTGLNGEHVAAVPTGRITASNAAQVAAYLNKVKEAESVKYDELWHKEVLHLSGGIQPIELSIFRQYMDGFASIAEGEFYGASVNTLGKHEPTAVELINISEQVNKGVNMVTFFGHSAPNATDIDIGYASDPAQGYNNPGKYPAFLVNGCSAGEFFNNITNFGEDWILTASKGARNFIANSSYGFSNNLRSYTDLIYEKGYADSIGIRSGIGNVQIEAAKKYLTN